LIEAHFHFFIMVGVVTLYQSWLPFGLAMLFVVVHHGTVGVIDPHSVYNHYAAIHKPWLWAGIHGLFITGAALAGLRSWKYAEVERERAEAAAIRLHDREIRQREAIHLNDTVVQGLVTAKYAAQLDQGDDTRVAIDRTLALAQELVSELMASDERLFEPGGLRSVAADPMPTGP
ncbi:MAG: methyl-accepting chemotaxis protein, partial [Actinomycetota bacterium]|nr:methyl-accepting chemotaxis protein [Actinomycetota bacterium]